MSNCCEGCIDKGKQSLVFYENPMECFNAPMVPNCYLEVYNKETDSCDCGNYDAEIRFFGSHIREAIKTIKRSLSNL